MICKKLFKKVDKDLPVKFLFIGRTASGKSEIARRVCKRLGLKQVKSMTTRPPRDNELNGESDHYFESQDEFDMMGSVYGFVAETTINGYQYATTYDELERSDIYVIDPDGVKSLKEHCGDKFRFVEIYFRVPYNLAEARYVSRGGTKQEFKQRYDKESSQFGEYEKAQAFDFHLLNDRPIEESVDIICKYINNELT